MLSFVVAGVSASLTYEDRKPVAADAQAEDYLGYAIAISGDTMVVGAPSEDTGGTAAGAAYVFQRDQGGTGLWGQVKKLTPDDASLEDSFGQTVAIEGDLIVVGAPYSSPYGIAAAGSAYIFSRDEGGTDNWGQYNRLAASDPAASVWLGSSVAIAGDTIVVGAPGEDTGGSEAGAAYIFSRNNGGPDAWWESKKLTASDADEHADFGRAVATNGLTVAVGAPLADVGAVRATGAVYVFKKGSFWTEQKKVVASAPRTYDSFGSAVALATSTLLVGAPQSNRALGSAYIFYPDQGGVDNWGQVVQLTASGIGRSSAFGASVALEGSDAIVGAWQQNTAGFADAGAAYIFSRGEGGTDVWGQMYEVNASDPAADTYFGKAVDLDSFTAAVGAMHAAVGGETQAGASYVFETFFPACVFDSGTFDQCLFGSS